MKEKEQGVTTPIGKMMAKASPLLHHHDDSYDDGDSADDYGYVNDSFRPQSVLQLISLFFSCSLLLKLLSQLEYLSPNFCFPKSFIKNASQAYKYFLLPRNPNPKIQKGGE
jgi:hypothetical protein